MGSVGWDAPDPAGVEAPLLVADAEHDRSFDDHAELLVVVAVLREFRARIDFDHRERQSLTVDGASEISVRVEGYETEAMVLLRASASISAVECDTQPNSASMLSRDAS